MDMEIHVIIKIAILSYIILLTLELKHKSEKFCVIDATVEHDTTNNIIFLLVRPNWAYWSIFIFSRMNCVK